MGLGRCPTPVSESVRRPHVRTSHKERSMKYVLAYYGGGMADTPEEQAKVMEAWGAWFGGLGANLVDGGVPFTGNVKGVSSAGSVSAGPIGHPAPASSIASPHHPHAPT